MVVGIVLGLGAIGNALDPESGRSTSPTDQPTTKPSVAATPAADAKLGTRSEMVGFFGGRGFSGSENTLADGRPRWLGRNAESWTAEVIGPAEAVDQASLTVIAGAAGGIEMGLFLGLYAPDAVEFFSDTMGSYSGSDLDVQKHFGDRTVHIQTLTASDGAIVITTIDHD